MGGVLMNESITRAAGAVHGQEVCADEMEALIRGRGPHAAAAHHALRPVPPSAPRQRAAAARGQDGA